MWFFRSPTLIHGQDALTHLRELRIARAFVVTDANVRRAGLVDPVLSELDRAGARHEVFDAIEPEPTLQTITAGVAALRTCAPDWIVAVGGGSVLDAAKAMWVLYENPGLDLEALTPLEPIELRRKARMIAIPTTAGTGSEATWAFVITLPGDPPRKLGSGHPSAVPDVGIVDPHLSRSMPRQLTADSGMDALTQAVEGYLATWANDYTDGLCLIATQLALEYLPRAYHQPDDLIAREKMANAAAIGGLGYINAMVGLAHSMGHALGAVFQVPHGRAVGLFLPYVIEFYGAADRPADVRTRLAALCKHLGLRHDDEHIAAKALAHKVREVAKAIGQPLSVSDAGVDYSEFEARLRDLIDNAMNDTVIFAAPRQPTLGELRALFVRAYEGGRGEL